ncbi:putative histidine kinase of the competence regulon ComD [Clostridium sp. CAG:302]|nr:putative histidine kinase of the competence regulon ComD [Clostridium sp. CAG:302]
MLLSSTLLILTLYTFGRIIIVNRRHKNIMIDVLILLGFILLNILVFKYTTGTIKTIITCLLYSSLFFCIFNIKLSKSVFTSIVYVILLVIPDLLILSTAIYILGISKEYYYSDFASSLLGNISVCLCLVIITYVLKKPLKKLINYNLSTNKKIIVMSSITLVMLAIFFYNLIKTFEFNNNIITYLVIIVMLICILLYLFKQKIENEKISKKYDELLDVMKSYESDIEEQRTLRHETKNEFATIKCKLQDKEDNKTIIEYIDSVIGEKEKAGSTKYSKFKYLPSNGLKGFFYYKFIEAEKKGINVSINISKQIENSFLKDIETKDFKDLARIIGVYLDNAIEASSTSEDKKLGIEMYLIKEKIEIIITNTFNNEINLDKIGKESFSTKGKHRGHGLLLVNKILSENNMFEAKNEIRGNIYIQSLKIKDNKKNYDE